jgi:hypothetical protein
MQGMPSAVFGDQRDLARLPKASVSTLLLAFSLFVNAAKGISSLQLGRNLGLHAKTAFVLLHKLRCALTSNSATTILSGVVEIDGGWFGGHWDRGWDLAESHVVPALVNKRAEIAGMITRTEQQLGQFRADLVHLDATIQLFAPEMEPKTIPAKRIRQSDLWFEQGELSRRVLDALRRAGEPIRAPDRPQLMKRPSGTHKQT